MLLPFVWGLANLISPLRIFFRNYETNFIFKVLISLNMVMSVESWCQASPPLRPWFLLVVVAVVGHLTTQV